MGNVQQYPRPWVKALSWSQRACMHLLLVYTCFACLQQAAAWTWKPLHRQRQQQQQEQPTTSPFKPPSPFCIEPAAVSCRQQTSMSGSRQLLRVYHSLYFHNHKMYALLDAQQLAGTAASSTTAATAGRQPGSSSGAVAPTQCSQDATTINSSSSSKEDRSSSSSSSSQEERSRTCGLDPIQLIDLRPSTNKGIEPLPVANVSAFLDNVQVCCIPGTTLLIDFPFSAFPENLGYWAELLLPLYGALRTAGWSQYLKGGSTGIDRIMLTNVQKLIYDWPRQVLQLAVAGALSNSSSSAAGREQVEVPLLEERELYSYCQAGWVVFENMLVVKDRYWDYAVAEQRRKVVYHLPPVPTGQPSLFDRSQFVVGFANSQDYSSFRTAAHQQVMWPLQPPSGRPVVTVLLYPEGYPTVVNHQALVHMLEDMLEPRGIQVRVASLTMEAPFVSHLATVSSTRLLIGRHGPLLASAALMAPGAAVLELLPYKWEWRGISGLYANITRSTGAVHYWSWRPEDVHWCRYQDAADARFANWTSQECVTKECLLAHARAGLVVDLGAVKQLLMSNMKVLLAGTEGLSS